VVLPRTRAYVGSLGLCYVIRVTSSHERDELRNDPQRGILTRWWADPGTNV